MNSLGLALTRLVTGSSHNPNFRFWRAVAPALSRSIAIALVTWACFRLVFNLATRVFLYMIIVVLVALLS